MNIQEIQQAITNLSPEELIRFRVWFKEYESNVKSVELSDSQTPTRDLLKKLRGSFKGSGLMKALIKEKSKERLI